MVSNQLASIYQSNFEQISDLGKGAFGEVYVAKKKSDGRKYAVKKVLLPEKEEEREKVFLEVQSLSTLEHVNIVRYYESWVELEDESSVAEDDNDESDISQSYSSSRGSDQLATISEDSSIKFKRSCYSLYIQMELCEKTNLKHWLAIEGERNYSEVQNIFRQIVNALTYIHSKGLIHRDLKPDNIFFTSDGRVKVGDFGLVTHGPMGDEDLCVRTANAGTSVYMAPELKSSIKEKTKVYDKQVDVYSLGILFFELLVAFGSRSERALVLTNLKEKKEFPYQFSDRFPQEFKLLQLMLREDPTERPKVGELLNKLTHPEIKGMPYSFQLLKSDLTISLQERLTQYTGKRKKHWEVGVLFHLTANKHGFDQKGDIRIIKKGNKLSNVALEKNSGYIHLRINFQPGKSSLLEEIGPAEIKIAELGTIAESRKEWTVGINAAVDFPSRVSRCFTNTRRSFYFKILYRGWKPADERFAVSRINPPTSKDSITTFTVRYRAHFIPWGPLKGRLVIARALPKPPADKNRENLILLAHMLLSCSVFCLIEYLCYLLSGPAKVAKHNPPKQ